MKVTGELRMEDTDSFSHRRVPGVSCVWGRGLAIVVFREVMQVTGELKVPFTCFFCSTMKSLVDFCLVSSLIFF